MRILGLSDGPSPAAVLVDGTDLAAVAFADPHAPEDPDAVVRAALDVAGCELWDVQRVVFGSHMGRTAPRVGRRGRLRLLREVVLKETGLWTLPANRRRREITEHLHAGGFDGDARSIDHFHALAEAAWRTQGRERCLVLTAAGGGDGTTVAVMVGGHDGLQLRYRQGGLSSLRDYRGLLAHRLAEPRQPHRDPLPWLTDDDEPPRDLVRVFRRHLHFAGRGFNLAVSPGARRFELSVQQWRLEDLASAWQANLEHQFRRLVRHWVERTGVGHLAVGGEVFANPQLVRSLASMEEVDTLHVLPRYGEPAVALGAALRFADLGPLSHPPRFCGADLSDRACRDALQAAGLPHHEPGDLAAEVASLLERGALVGWARGRAAWSTDPLGRRCVLCSPADAGVVARAARQLGHDPRVPPTCLVEAGAVQQHFPGFARVAAAAHFASAELEPATGFRVRCRGVLARDGSARPLLLGAEEGTGVGAVLRGFVQQTGIPALCALDLHLAGAPAPRTPAEVLDAARRSHLDALVLGPYLVHLA